MLQTVMTVKAPLVGTDAVADALLEDYLVSHRELGHVAGYELPARAAVAQVVERCLAVLFPGYMGGGVARLSPTELRDLVRERVSELLTATRRQVYRALHHRQQLQRGTDDADCPDCAASADAIAHAFIAGLPELRAACALDVRAAFEGDPAATGLDEILFCYPGTYAIAVYRIAHALARAGAVLVPRMMTELAHERTGIDLHPGASIGQAFFIDHGTGVVVGETSLIGDRVRLYQGVTLGALSVPRGQDRPARGARRHPTLEDDVVVYAGATILGGETVIGRGAVIGGNAWVTASVPPGQVVAGAINRR
jgi:serine O-acetyltransferase